MRKTALKRKTPLRAKTGLKRTSTLKKVSKKQAKRMRVLSSLDKILLERCKGLCEVCKRPPDWRGLAKHHKVKRSHMGADTEDNLIMVCAKCHSNWGHRLHEVDSEPQWSKE